MTEIKSRLYFVSWEESKYGTALSRQCFFKPMIISVIARPRLDCQRYQYLTRNGGIRSFKYTGPARISNVNRSRRAYWLSEFHILVLIRCESFSLKRLLLVPESDGPEVIEKKASSFNEIMLALIYFPMVLSSMRKQSVSQVLPFVWNVSLPTIQIQRFFGFWFF